MSEIFNKLKRPKAVRPRNVRTGDFKPLRDVSAEEGPPSAPVEDALVNPPAAPDRTLEIRSGVEFDISSADRRIRTVLDPLTMVGEHYRLLRTKLAQMQKERGVKTLLVTSSLPVEGKTFTACCLAGVFAQEPGKKVLLIDADLRKPRATHDLGMNNSAPMDGLSQVLRGEKRPEEVMLGSTSLDFFLLPSGSIPDAPAELLSSPLLERTIRTMREHFDWIVIDSPPVIGLADASLIAPLCDSVLLVVRSNKTPSKVVKQAIERIGRNRICGLVMNRGKEVRNSRYYHYYHRGRKAK